MPRRGPLFRGAIFGAGAAATAARRARYGNKFADIYIYGYIFIYKYVCIEREPVRAFESLAPRCSIASCGPAFSRNKNTF